MRGMLALVTLSLPSYAAIPFIIPQSQYLTLPYFGSPINAPGTNAGHPMFSPDGTRVAWQQSRPLTGGAYDVVVANADGSSPNIITQTAFARTNLPKGANCSCGNPQWAFDSQGLIIQCQASSSVLSYSQANPGAGPDNVLIYIDKAGSSSIIELAGDIPCTTSATACVSNVQTQGGFLQGRMSRNPKSGNTYYWGTGHTYSWSCGSSISLCQRFEVMTYTQSPTPTLTGTGINQGIEGSNPIVPSTSPPSGSGVCLLQAITGTTGDKAAGFISYANGTWAFVNITFNGNRYTSIPTTWAISGSSTCSGVGSITTSGGAFSGDDYAVPDGVNPYFIEMGDTDPLENPSHTMYFSSFGSTPVTGILYKFDLNNLPAGAIRVSSATGWNEMPQWSTLFHSLCYVTSTVTPFIPTSAIGIALDLACTDSVGNNLSAMTWFNLAGNLEYFHNGTNTTVGVFSFAPDMSHVAVTLFDNVTFVNVYILPINPAVILSGGGATGVQIQ